jgi:hypothetical protein
MARCCDRSDDLYIWAGCYLAIITEFDLKDNGLGIDGAADSLPFKGFDLNPLNQGGYPWFG